MLRRDSASKDAGSGRESKSVVNAYNDSGVPPPHRRRVRYTGKNPRRFEDKYKEHAPEKFPETIAKVLASGKTPAGTHVPILVSEILDVLRPQPGEIAVDCTLGYGGHAREILKKILPGGCLVALDADPIEMARTSARLREEGYSEDSLILCRSNFAGLSKAGRPVGYEDESRQRHISFRFSCSGEV